MSQFFDTQAGYEFCCGTMPRIADSLEAIAKHLEGKLSKKEARYRELLESVVEDVTVNRSLSEQVEILRGYGFADEDLKEFGYSEINTAGLEEDGETPEGNPNCSPIGEEMYPYVQMSFRCRILNKDGNVRHHPESIWENSFGGYSFVVGGKTAEFDWDACSWDIEGETVTVNTGYGPFLNDFRLPDYYDDELAKEGLTRMDLTPEFLSRCERIENIFCEAGDVIVDFITFYDEEGNAYSVNEDVIKAFNAGILKKYGK